MTKRKTDIERLKSARVSGGRGRVTGIEIAEKIAELQAANPALSYLVAWKMVDRDERKKNSADADPVTATTTATTTGETVQVRISRSAYDLIKDMQVLGGYASIGSVVDEAVIFLLDSAHREAEEALFERERNPHKKRKTKTMGGIQTATKRGGFTGRR